VEVVFVRYELRPAEISDVHVLARTLRDGDRLEMTSLGLSPVMALRRAFRGAIIRRTAIIDGEIAAMWGMEGAMLGPVGYPWMLTAPPVERVPIAFLREARKGVCEMLRLKNRLEGHVAADYTCACRFLEVVGFRLGEPEPKGPHGIKFRSFVMER
jgi:hypothetical protein